MLVKNKLGLSLIGLLIGMALGVIILGGMMQIFTSVRRSSTLITNEIELNETLLLVIQNMSKIIAQAGHIKPTATRTAPLLNIFTQANNPASYPSWYLVNDAVMGINGSSLNSLLVRFTDDANANIVHCDGQILTSLSDTNRYSRYALSGTAAPYDLVCTIYDPSYSTSPTTITLASGMVVNLFFLFGEDRNLDNIIDQYVPTPAYQTVSGQNRYNYCTQTVRVGIIMRSKNKVFPVNTPQTFTLFQNKAPFAFNDQYLYRSAVFTIPLLDRLQ